MYTVDEYSINVYVGPYALVTNVSKVSIGDASRSFIITRPDYVVQCIRNTEQVKPTIHYRPRYGL